MSKNNMQITRGILHNAAKYGHNVILEGAHGTGKTAMVTKVFEKEFGKKDVKWVYFSASTLDPFVDFIGCPKAMKNEEGLEYLGLIRPELFAGDGPEAIFMDEFNRAAPKTRNAMMELIQFKSINGKHFPNLKCVWAAINPEGEGYDVENLDPAQKDRFHMQIQFPSDPDFDYFSDKFGSDVAKSAIKWLKTLDKDIRKNISPRRLDYTLEAYKSNIDIGPYLPKKTNLAEFRKCMQSSNLYEKLDQLKTKEDKEKFFRDENNFRSVKELCMSKDNIIKYVPFWPKEKINAEIAVNENFVFELVHDFAYRQTDKAFKDEINTIEGILRELIKARQNPEICDVISSATGIEV